MFETMRRPLLPLLLLGLLLLQQGRCFLEFVIDEEAVSPGCRGLPNTQKSTRNPRFHSQTFLLAVKLGFISYLFTLACFKTR